MHYVAAHADEFQACRAVDALRFVPIHAAKQNDRHIGKGFDIIDHGRLVPETLLNRKWRFIARFRALSFDGLEQCRFFAADVSPGADKNLEIKCKLAAENAWSQQATAFATANLIAQDF